MSPAQAVHNDCGMGKIVLVDDDESVRRLYATLLRSAGHEVIEREDTTELLDVLRRERPSLVLLDFSLPRENGATACRRIKTTPDLMGTRVVMITAHDSFESIRETAAAGADGHLVKPVPLDRLLACVEQTSAPRPPQQSRIVRALRSLVQ